jgi:hypothetical protein
MLRVKAWLPETNEFLLCNVNGFVTTYLSIAL